MQLILKNIKIPVAVRSSTYATIIRAWKQVMIGLERLLNGEPQSVTDGAILLALSAWHLYPDLVVLGSQTVNIKFADSLMHPAGVVTIGLTSADNDQWSGERIYWSLALSHYKFYSDTVNVTGGKEGRLTIEQLQLVAFGSLLGSWNFPRGDPIPAAHWFIALRNCVLKAKPSLKNQLHWLQVLAMTAQCLLESETRNGTQQQ